MTRSSDGSTAATAAATSKVAPARGSTATPVSKEKSGKVNQNEDKGKEQEERPAVIPPLRERFPFWKEVGLTWIAVVLMPMYSMLISLGIYIVMVYLAPKVWLRSILLLYIPYIVLWDPSPSRGNRPFGKRSEYRSRVWYKWFAQYFDMKLVKTSDCNLDPTKHYIMLYHPHGIIGVGTNAALNTNGCHFDQVFPGLERAGVTLNESFWAPLLREWVLAMGYISANKATLRQALEVQSIVLVPGGAAEALHAKPGVMKLYLQNRRGFVKLALETGCPLVPCIGFGENEIYDASGEPSWFQNQWSKVVRFSIPNLKHIVPRKAKVTVVVGEPVDFGTEEDVDKCHALYLRQLKRFYDRERDKYGYQNIELEFI